jgi:hypothetical protein
MRTAKSYWLLALVAGVLLAAPVVASATTMADLLQGGSIIVGDKEIYGFHNYSSVASGGALSVDPSTIFVQPYIFGAELGVRFQTAFFYAGPGQMQDTYFDFLVRILPGYENWLISDNTLMMTGSYSGTGRASIAEVVRTADEMTSLADKLTIVSQDFNKSVDHKIFPFPVPAIHVSKDIGVVGGLSGAAFVSDFGQSFSQVPEPATLSFLVLGGIGALLGRKRR